MSLSVKLKKNWAQIDRVLHYISLEKLANCKQSSLVGPVLSYEGN
jgi:hypothetical protein